MASTPSNYQRGISARDEFQTNQLTSRGLSSRTDSQNESRKAATITCMHDAQEATALEGEAAFDTFIRCLKKHIIPDTLTEFNKVKQRILETVDKFGDLMAITVKERQTVSDQISRLSDKLSLAHRSIDIARVLDMTSSMAKGPGTKELLP